MNTEEILQYVDLSSLVTKKAFLSIITSESSAAKRMAIATATGIAEKINPSGGGYLEKISVGDFMVFAEDHYSKVTKKIEYRLLVAPFKGLWVHLAAFLYDLNGDRFVELSKLSDKAYLEAGDAAVLAGLYLSLMGDRA